MGRLWQLAFAVLLGKQPDRQRNGVLYRKKLRTTKALLTLYALGDCARPTAERRTIIRRSSRV